MEQAGVRRAPVSGRGRSLCRALFVAGILTVTACGDEDFAADDVAALDELTSAAPAPSSSVPSSYGEVVEGETGPLGEAIDGAIASGCPLNANYWERPLLSTVPECGGFLAEHSEYADDARLFGTRQLLPEGSLYTVLTVGQVRHVATLAAVMRREIHELYAGEFDLACGETRIFIARVAGTRSPEPLYDGIQFVSVQVTEERPDTEGLAVTC